MNVYLNKTGRLFADIMSVSEIRQISFDEMFCNHLKPYFDSDLGYILQQDADYTLFAIPKNALNSDLELFVNCFPTRDSRAVHTVDEFCCSWSNTFFNSLENCNRAILEIAERADEKLLKIYSVQHIGLNELNEHEFGTTYNQIHWHIYGVTQNLIERCMMQGVNSRFSMNHRNTFRDPFVCVYYDLIKDLYPLVSIDGDTGSLILRETELSLDICSLTRSLVKDVLSIWKERWLELASCLTDFTVSSSGRFLPLKMMDRMARLQAFCDKNPCLSEPSKRVIRLLGRQLLDEADLKNLSNKDYWNTLHMGINGSIGFTHDFQRRTSTLRLAPRILAVQERVGATDGNYLCLKDRSTFLPNDIRDGLIERQKALLSQLKLLSMSRQSGHKPEVTISYGSNSHR